MLKVEIDVTFKIARAELFLDCDETGAVSFLSNAALLLAKPRPNGLDFERMQSPSQVIKVSFELLQSTQKLTTTKAC